MQFSGAIKLGGGLDDYLAPAQNCVLPLMQATKSSSNQPGGKVSMSSGADLDPLAGLLQSLPTASTTTTNNNPNNNITKSTPTMANDLTTEVPGSGFTQMKSDGDKAKITLADCLSCSGCVTTAESILIAQHSSTHLMTVLNAILRQKHLDITNNTTTPSTLTVQQDEISQYESVVVSISLPSLLSISALFETAPSQMFHLISSWFKEIGVEQTLYALDAQSEALYTAALEFEARYRNVAKKHNFALPQLQIPHFPQQTSTNPIPTSANSDYDLTANPNNAQFTQESLESDVLPLMSSECPGWVCVSEKTQGTKMISYMASTRSPQSILGVHAKAVNKSSGKTDGDCEGCDCDAKKCGEKKDEIDFIINPKIFHVSIQPCYDKKLEATREVFELTQKNDNDKKDQVKSQCCQDDNKQEEEKNNTSGCCQDDQNTSTDTTSSTGCCQDSPTTTTTDDMTYTVPYVDLVLSTHELVDMLVNNIQTIVDETTTTTEEPSVPMQDGQETNATESPVIEQQQAIITPLSVSNDWIKLWVQYNKDQQHSTTNKSTQLIYRVPGLNTSSGGYAESVLLHSLGNIFKMELEQKQGLHNTNNTKTTTLTTAINSLEWASVANNDIKAILVDYLGSGYDINGDKKNEDEVGIYAIRGANATLITHGAKLDQICKIVQSNTNTSITNDNTQSIPAIVGTRAKIGLGSLDDGIDDIFPMKKKTTVKLGGFDDDDDIVPVSRRKPTPAVTVSKSGLDDDNVVIPRKKRVGLATMTSNIDDEDFGPSLKTKSTPQPTQPSIPAVQCNCVSCTPMFKVNNLKYKQIKNKTTPYLTPNLDDTSIITSSQSLHKIMTPVQYKLTQPLANPVCVLTTCTAFGLRNVQAIIQQHTQTNKAPLRLAIPSQQQNQSVSNIYHYVEVMSCPSGCINGGAQLTAGQVKNSRALLNTAVELYYNELNGIVPEEATQGGNKKDSKDENEELLIGQLTIEKTKEAQITQQKAILASIQQMYQDLPYISTPFPQGNIDQCNQVDCGKKEGCQECDDGDDDKNNKIALFKWMNNNALNLLYTKFNPIVVNEELVAMRW